MKRFSLKNMSAKAFIVSGGIALSLLFLILFLGSPPPTQYQYKLTKSAEVIEVYVQQSRFNRTTASARVRFEDGKEQLISFPTRLNILKGQTIKVDVLEADGEKPRYQLAHDPIQP